MDINVTKQSLFNQNRTNDGDNTRNQRMNHNKNCAQKNAQQDEVDKHLLLYAISPSDCRWYDYGINILFRIFPLSFSIRVLLYVSRAMGGNDSRYILTKTAEEYNFTGLILGVVNEPFYICSPKRSFVVTFVYMVCLTFLKSVFPTKIYSSSVKERTLYKYLNILGVLVLVIVKISCVTESPNEKK